MKSVRKQRGISLVGLAFLLAVASAVSFVGLKLLPHYMDFYALQSIITKPSAERAFDVQNAGDFYGYVERGMSVNNIRNLDLYDSMQVKVSHGSIEISLDYEVREPIAGNIEIVLVFKREYHIAQ